MLLPYKSRHLLRKKSVFFARTGRSVIQFYNKLAAVYWLPMFWPRRRPGTHGTHFVSMSGPTVHPYTVTWVFSDRLIVFGLFKCKIEKSHPISFSTFVLLCRTPQRQIIEDCSSFFEPDIILSYTQANM